MDTTRTRSGPSVCPHDCPSTCALEVEVLDGARIGAVRGAEDNSYTAGVICAKVARYAERIHHPDRLTQPLLRPARRAPAQFRRDLAGTRRSTASPSAFTADAARSTAREAVWPYLLRRHDGAGAARRHQPAAPRHALFARRS